VVLADRRRCANASTRSAARVRRTEASLDQAERELARNQKLMADGLSHYR